MNSILQLRYRTINILTALMIGLFIVFPDIVRDFPGADTFREDHLILPEVIFEDFECEVEEQMAEIFEIVWNAVGLSRTNSK